MGLRNDLLEPGFGQPRYLEHHEGVISPAELERRRCLGKDQSRQLDALRATDVHQPSQSAYGYNDGSSITESARVTIKPFASVNLFLAQRPGKYF